MLDKKIAAMVIARWAEVQDDQHKGYIAKDIASDHKFIEALIDVVFVTTVRAEEGVFPTFRVSYIPRTAIGNGDVSAAAPMQFENPQHLTPGSLAKLSGAFDTQLSSIAVDWDPENSMLMMWGVVHFAPSIDDLSGSKTYADGMPAQPPDYLTISSNGPAALEFSRGYMRLGWLTNGLFKVSEPTPFTWQSLGGQLAGLIEIRPPTHRQWTLVIVKRLLLEVARRGHGGTLAIVPSSIDIDDLPVAPRNKFTTGSFELISLVGDYAAARDALHAPPGLSPAQHYRELLSEMIARIAQLSVIDGALIMNGRLEVISFGSLLTAPLCELECYVGRDWQGTPSHEPFRLAQFGSRHQSAANFAAAVPGAVVFIASQDGPVRAMTRVEGRVEVWPDCNSSVFIS
jgi:hypothetical protein